MILFQIIVCAHIALASVHVKSLHICEISIDNEKIMGIMNLCEKKMSRPRGQDIGIFQNGRSPYGLASSSHSPLFGGAIIYFKKRICRFNFM